MAYQVSSEGDRVVYVLPGDPSGYLNKVGEVVKVMEQEMGLSPGWLWQKKHCKVGMRTFSIIFSIASAFFLFLPCLLPQYVMHLALINFPRF